jgi:tetrahydromethanopterin S-methyltransferase subunit B
VSLTSLTSWVHGTTLGISRPVLIAIIVVVLIEGRLGRSKDPRWRSVADALRSLLAMTIVPIVGRIPGLGPLVVALLNALAPVGAPPVVVPQKREKEVG